MSFSQTAAFSTECSEVLQVFDSYQWAWQLGNGWSLQIVIPEYLQSCLGRGWDSQKGALSHPFAPIATPLSIMILSQAQTLEVPSKIKVFLWFKRIAEFENVLYSINILRIQFSKIENEVCTTSVKKVFPEYHPLNLDVPWETAERNRIPSSADCSLWAEGTR